MLDVSLAETSIEPVLMPSDPLPDIKAWELMPIQFSAVAPAPAAPSPAAVSAAVSAATLAWMVVLLTACREKAPAAVTLVFVDVALTFIGNLR